MKFPPNRLYSNPDMWWPSVTASRTVGDETTQVCIQITDYCTLETSRCTFQEAYGCLPVTYATRKNYRHCWFIRPEAFSFFRIRTNFRDFLGADSRLGTGLKFVLLTVLSRSLILSLSSPPPPPLWLYSPQRTLAASHIWGFLSYLDIW
jgi:hypothetical protein